jgi:hypothetical protein
MDFTVCEADRFMGSHARVDFEGKSGVGTLSLSFSDDLNAIAFDAPCLSMSPFAGLC